MSSRFSFASGANAEYLEGLYEDFAKDPESVDPSWQKFFEGYDFAVGKGIVQSGQTDEGALVEAYINAFRRLGHLSAHLNPLAEKPPLAENMSPSAHGLGDVSSSAEFVTANYGEGMQKFADICSSLQETYCGRIGADFREINDIETVSWFQEKMESCKNQPKFDDSLKVQILKKLTEAEGFEKFLQARYVGQKRFSLEGCDALIPMMDVLIEEAGAKNADEICIGMAHRGRLNVLANIMKKPIEQMLIEFEGSEFNAFDIDGDVKYHLGYANEVETQSGKKVRLYLSPNPSHLEAVNPVLEGFVRSRQNQHGDVERRKFIPVLMHGDASFIGQGLVMETLNLSELSDYETGGTIHIIINNQIGFTTDPSDSRSCVYSSDIAKMVRAPVLHVNADDPEAAVWVMQIAAAYRQKFGKDVVIDLSGYRRHGHNEGDEPGFTQPLLYKKISKHPTCYTQYLEKAVQENIVSAEKGKALMKEFRAGLQSAFDNIKKDDYKVTLPELPTSLADVMNHKKISDEEFRKTFETSVDAKLLKDLAEKICSFPSEFSPHPKVKKLLDTRSEMGKGKGKLDWAMAELLAFSSLAVEGHKVRLSGQDCKRGTFTHRHGVWFDFESGEAFEPLSHLSEDQSPIEIINSPLSEQGCLGFEFGYSVADRNALVIWEAQFGDFCNGGQIIIDQFIAASEAKWSQSSGLVMLLPHGYEGQGPEHSSARPERFLQLCGNRNMQVCNVTTPAQLFHMLRRQLKREFRKPLVVMTPKSLLRHPKVVSTWTDFSKGNFSEILPGEVKAKDKIESVILCSGKIYYELEELRAAEEIDNVSIIRLEQLYPFPKRPLKKLLAEFGKLKSVHWTQEEPQNMGAWSFVRPRLEVLLEDIPLSYIGRKYSGTTAEGSGKAHEAEQKRILREALGLDAVNGEKK